MSLTSFKELDLFQQIADAIGGTLEEVYNLQEKERKDLITVLGLEEVDYNDNYQEVSSSMERSKYRTRTVVKKETEREVNVTAALEDGGAAFVEGIPDEVSEKDHNGNIITSDRDIIKSDTNSETKAGGGDKESSSPYQRNTVLVVKQSTSANSPDMISDLPPTTPVTQTKSSGRSRLSLKRKGRNTSVPKTKLNPITETCLDSDDQFAPLEVTHQPPSGYRQPVPSFLIQKLSSHSSANMDLPGSSSLPSLPYNLLGNLLSSHPLPVQDVLARRDLPLHQGQQVAGGGGDWRKYRGELDNVCEKISKFKSPGLVHAGTESGIIWTDRQMKLWGKKSVKMVEQRQNLRRSTRKVKKSFSISDSVFVSGDWALSSEEEVGRQTPSEVNVSKKTEDNDGLPVKDEGGVEGENEEKKRKGGKRKLFSKNKDYMDDSAESGKEDSFDEEERKRKYPGTRKGLRRTLDSLKKEGSFSDLCGD